MVYNENRQVKCKFRERISKEKQTGFEARTLEMSKKFQCILNIFLMYCDFIPFPCDLSIRFIGKHDQIFVSKVCYLFIVIYINENSAV